MNYSRLASSFINFNKSSFLPCSQQCCQLGYDEVSPLFLGAFFIWSRFTYLRALVITKGLAADSANLEEVYNEQKRQQNSPNLSGDHKALSLHREDGFASTERDSAATCWPSEQSVALQADGLDTTAAVRHFSSFTQTHSHGIAPMSLMFLQRRHTVMFMNQSCLGSTCVHQPSITHAHIAHTAMNAYTAINVNTSSISYTADIPSRLLINFFTIVSTANTELGWWLL